MVAFARRQPGKAGSRRPMSVKHALLMGCIGIIVLLCIRNNLIIGMGMGHPQASEIQRVSNVGQTLKFVQYRPSKLEQDWYDKKQEYDLHPSEICKDLAHHTEEMRSWISFLDHDQGDNSDVDDGVFSRLVFEDNNGNEYTKIIEPLVGHFRHPYGLPHCKPEGNAVQAQDRSYIAFGGARKVDSSFFPGKRYLFDLGTAKFNSSLRYLISRYSELGIEFDSIWAWEAKPLSNYWKSVPHNVQGNLHFYNQAITSDLNSASHPLQILKRIYKHGDFVVLKLDIDNTPLEMSIMQEFEQDDALRNMIADFMFELHYDSADMRVYFGTPDLSYAEALTIFRSFRELGLPLHYWP